MLLLKHLILQGPMSFPINQDKLEATFKKQKYLYTSHAMLQHIPRENNNKMKGEFPKKVTDFILLKYFCAYFQKIVFRLNKILGEDGSMDASPSLYVIDLDIQDPHTNVGYDFGTFIANSIHQEMVTTQRGDLGNFKFLHYSLLMHLVLFYNMGHVDSIFIKALDNFGEALPIQRWTRLWQRFYSFSNSLSLYNDFVATIHRMLGSKLERLPRLIRKIFIPTMCSDDELPIDHDRGSAFLLQNCTVIIIFGCSQPPYFLPRYVLERLGIVEIFWQLLFMNREYLGPTVEKGSFLCRNLKLGDFEIGKEAI